MSASSWTDDRVQILSRLWREGQSANQIARALAGGVTRNAVIGKIHRLGLSGRARRARSKSKPPRASRQRVGPARMFAKATLPDCTMRAPQTGLATIVSICRGQCRWPLGPAPAGRPPSETRRTGLIGRAAATLSRPSFRAMSEADPGA